jgi:hypothetical protein
VFFTVHGEMSGNGMNLPLITAPFLVTTNERPSCEMQPCHNKYRRELRKAFHTIVLDTLLDWRRKYPACMLATVFCAGPSGFKEYRTNSKYQHPGCL